MTGLHKLRENLIWSCFVADALSLGSHWVYESEKIKQKLGTISKFHNPISIYHPTKSAGDFTHYGDQLFVLLKSIHDNANTYVAQQFMKDWKSFMFEYDGYVDHATRETLENIEESNDFLHSGSNSKDLSVVSRIAPLIGEDLATIKQAAKLTHNSEDVEHAIEYVYEVLVAIHEGADKETAILKTPTELPDVQQGAASISHDTTHAIKQLGPACDVQGGLAGAIHCILKYNTLKEALLANVQAGGDCAARGFVIAMVFTALTQHPPKAWVDALKKRKEIESLLK